MVEKNEKNSELDHKGFRIQTNVAVCEKKHVSTSVLESVPVYITLKKECFHVLEKLCFMELKQPDYGPFLNSDRP